MEKKNTACPVCGGTEYIKEIGFYYCIECQTQSQELREEVFETKYDLGTPVTKGKNIKVNAVKDKGNTGENWTTWEAYNFILKGQVEELINSGASPEFKYTVLQLWAHYLKKLEVAFTSERKQQLPKIGPSYHSKDRSLVYGTPSSALRKNNKKKQRPRSVDLDKNSVSTASFTSDRKRFNQSKSALMALEAEIYTREAESSRDCTSILNRSGSDLNGSACSTSVRSFRRTCYTKEAAKWLSRQHSKKKKKKKKPLGVLLRKPRIFHYTNPNTLSRFRLLVLLYIALLCSGEAVQLSDILRWVREGHLSYYETSHLLPSYYVIKGSDRAMLSPDIYLPSYSNFRKTAVNMAKLLEVTQWARPDLQKLTVRFIKELQLPEMLSTLVERFLAVTPFSATWGPQELPNYESRVVAIIIVILKLLLGLDGKTEDYISACATEINGLLIRKDTTCTQLFVWADWVRYLVCRKAVVIRHHFPTKDKVAPEVFIKPHVYLDCWQQLRSKHEDSKVVRKDTIKPVLVDAMKLSFMKLAQLETTAHAEIYFPPSLTPYTTYIECIMSSRLNSEETIPREMLCKNFTAMDMEYLLNPKQYVAFAEAEKCKINLKKGSAQLRFKKVKRIRKKPRENQVYFDKKLVLVNILEEGKEKVERINKKGGRRGERSYQRLKKRRKGDIPDDAKVLRNMVKQNHGSSGESGVILLSSDACEVTEELSSKDEDSVIIDDQIETCRPNKEVDNVSTANWKVTKMFRKCINVPPEVLPDEAVLLLHQYLTNSSVIADVMNSAAISGKKRKRSSAQGKHTLYLPYRQYWMLQHSVEEMNDDSFQANVVSRLPLSFMWLLTECAQMLEMSTKDLYNEIVVVETMCAKILNQ